MLRDEYGVGRVVLFGSFARGDIHDESDVDLAIDRELGVDYFSIVGRCSAMLGYDVHLLEMPKAPPSLLARLAAEGIVV